MLGQNVRAEVIKKLGETDKSGFTHPLNYALINGSKKEYAYILGVDHPVKHFDGKVIASLLPIKKYAHLKKVIWIIAPKSARPINLDVLEYINMEDFPEYRLKCLYELSCGAIVYKYINGSTKYLLIKNKRSAYWGFPKGHIEKGETKYDAATREVLEETGIHVKIHEGFEGISKFNLSDKTDKRVSIFIGTTDNTATKIQDEEIDDYVWATYKTAMVMLKFANDKKILYDAVKFLKQKQFIKEKEKV